MKYKIFFFILLISIKTNCQLTNLDRFYSENLTKKHEKNISVYKIKVYKIAGKIYETDEKTFFSMDKDIIYKNITSDAIYTMIYKNRYLFVGYFPNTEEETMLPFAYWDRFLNRLDVIDLKNKSKKWTYKFNTPTIMKNIKSFNPKDGDIVYCNHRKPEKVITD